MNRKEFDVQLLLTDHRLRAYKIKEHLTQQELFETDVDPASVKGHIEKSEHNLEFVYSLKPAFDDWKIVGAYYAMYHAALALCAKAGFKSRNHGATLVILIDVYGKSILNSADFDELAQAFLSKDDFLFYSQVRESRKEASYAKKLVLVNDNVEKIISGAKSFIGKVRKILQED